MQNGQHCCGGRRPLCALRDLWLRISVVYIIHITENHMPSPAFSPVRAREPRSQRTADDDTRRHDCRHTDRILYDPTKIEVTSKTQRTVDAPLAVVLCGFRLTRSSPFPPSRLAEVLEARQKAAAPCRWVGGRCLSVEILSESACVHAQGLRYAKFAAMRSKRHACVSRFVVCCCRRPLRWVVRQFRHS